MKKLNDPQIKLTDAILAFGNKSSLAKALCLHRVTVTEWVNKDKLTNVPAVHAYRLIRHYPKLFSETAN